ncbi:MAG: protein kinase [Moorea sp. SIO2B7]|nr:protein kinase [Moorena sp. SIO2B7]
MTETILAGHYQIVKHLGGGGFGQTFLAKDLHLPDNPLCVVKQLKPKFSDPQTLQTAKRLFNREAETLYQLGHNDQIPQLLAHFEQDDEFYLVQQFIDGQTLKQEITPGKQLSEVSVISLLQDILQVLSFVHQQKVIHRDLKPANLIRRSSDNKIILIDFGAVKAVSAKAANVYGHSSLTVAIGSPGYMPSEQNAGTPHFSSDVYAVGMLCLQALTGLHPMSLPQDSLGEYCCATFGDTIPVSPDLAAILDKMVRYDYRQRYRTATEALKALEEQLNVPTKLTNPPGIFPVGEEISSGKDKKLTTLSPTQPPKDLEQPEGQVSLDSRFYVQRPPIESDCYEAIIKPAALIRVKAPRQMGKTSLMSRILDHAQQQGYQTAFLNFQSADAEFLTNLDLFLRWFCASISEELELEEKLDQYWKGPLGSKNQCTKYFQRYLLAEIPNPLALGLDEVDQIFQHPEIAIDFFGLLRAWHERGKNEEIWKKLRLVIVHSKEVYIPLNINQSPFNVGLPIELPELTMIQVQELLILHGLTWSNNQLEQLMNLVGGHPYLVRWALYQIARNRMTFEELLKIAATEEGPYGDHLRRHLLNLEQNTELLTAIKQVLAADHPIEIGTSESFKLRSMGLVKFQGNAVIPLCDLYRQYFRVRLK